MKPVNENLEKISEQFFIENYYVQLLDEFFTRENVVSAQKEAVNVEDVTDKLPGLMNMIYKEAEKRNDRRSRSQILKDTNIIISQMLDNNSVNSMLDNSEKLIVNVEPSEDALISNLNSMTQEPWHHPSENVDDHDDGPSKKLEGHHRPSLSNTVDDLELASQLSETEAEKKVYIQDLFLSFLPKNKQITSDILGVCFHIFSLDIEVSRLNQAYTGHCAPDKEQRSMLREEHGASFGSFSDHQDLRILCRMNELENAGIDKIKFCLNMREKCTGKEEKTFHKPKWKVAGVRHILGLYVGQDIPERPTYSCYKRMMHLVLADKDQEAANARETAVTMGQINLETGLQVQEDQSPSTNLSHENSFQQYMRNVFSRSTTPISRSVTPSISLEIESSPESHNISQNSSQYVPQASPSSSRSASSESPHFVPIGPSSAQFEMEDNTSVSPSPDLSFSPISSRRKPIERNTSTGRKRKLANTTDLNGLLNPTSEAETTELDDSLPPNEKIPKLKRKSRSIPYLTPENPKIKRRRSIKKYEKLCRLNNSESEAEAGDNPDQYLKVVNPLQSQRSDSQNSAHLSNDRIVTIKDMYKLPSRSKTPGPIFAVCLHILNKDVEVSPVNIACNDHSWIRNRNNREELRRKYGAKFRAHNDHQDSLILKRFAWLKKANLFNDFNEFCNLLKKFTSLKERTKSQHKKKRNMRVRNIIGLFVGQDIPDKLAYYNYDRLLYLVLSQSKGVWRNRNYYEVDPETMRNRSTVRWTLEEDLELLQEVISAQVNIDNVAEIETMHVDWDKLCEDQRFAGRSKQNIREHWQQRIYPALVEEFDITEFLKYKINLLTKIHEQGATFRCEIDWDELATSFYPRSKPMLQQNFTTLIRGFGFDLKRIDNADEFSYRLKEASRKMSSMLCWPEDMLEKRFSLKCRESYMREMRYAAEKMIGDLA